MGGCCWREAEKVTGTDGGQDIGGKVIYILLADHIYGNISKFKVNIEVNGPIQSQIKSKVPNVPHVAHSPEETPRTCAKTTMPTKAMHACMHAWSPGT